ncbi:MAG: methyltransferase domain-containing protein [Planctomycetes bacterium]|nr:methyltransferase domain-containing protein [Planctomycetota bacterium]
MKENNSKIDENLLKFLACTACTAELTILESNLVCSECGKIFSCKNGIPDFAVDTEFYYGEIPKHAMEKVLSIHGQSVQESLRQVCEELGDDMPVHYALDHLRAIMLLLAQSKPNMKVLDLGCGWGTLSLFAARLGAEVVAMDLSYLRAAFVKRVCEQQSLTNLHCVVGGDDKCLPFKLESFDLIILNGVLEWVPESLKGNPRAIQLDYLKKLALLLNQDGQIAIGIENRHNYNYFLGHPDDHTGLRFGAILPRPIANIYSLLVRKKPYRTYTHNEKNIRKLFKQADLPSTQVYGCSPDYRHPQVLARVDSKVGIKELYSRYNLGWLTKMILKLASYFGITREAVPSFMALSKRNGSADNLILNILKENSGKDWALEWGRVTSSGAFVGLYNNQAENIIVRVGLDDDLGNKRIQANWDGLKLLDPISKTMPSVVPTPILKTNFKDMSLTSETLLRGSILMKESQERCLTVMDKVLDVMSQLSSQFEHKIASQADWQQKCSEIIENIKSKLQMSDSWQQSATDKLSESCPACQIQIGLIHGDLHPSNILCSSDLNEFGIIDWDLIDESNFTFFDGIKFMVQLITVKQRVSWTKFVIDIMKNQISTNSYANPKAILNKISQLGYTSEMFAFFALNEIMLHLENRLTDQKERDDFIEVCEQVIDAL